jgi:hypothetical protein
MMNKILRSILALALLLLLASVGGQAQEPGTDDQEGLDSIQGGMDLKDEVITDDLIVRGNACIGQDCASGESFGNDVLRLKDMNVRIHFMDTSSGSGFPTTDWRITINDSGSSGSNYFAIDDVDNGKTPFKIEAGAPTNALYVYENGRIGLGTSSPYEDLHIVTEQDPRIRLEQDGSVGWTPQTWDVGGHHDYFYVHDATNWRTPFKIETGAPEDSLYVKNNKNVGLGTDSPAVQLHVKGDAASMRVEKTDGTVTLDLDTSGNLVLAGLLTEASDAALKENFAPVDGASVLAHLRQLPIYTWNYRADDDTVRHMGPMAQDFYRLFELGADDKHIAPLDANGVALAGLQELSRLIEEQQTEIAEIEQENQEIEQRLAALEAVVFASELKPETGSR